MWGLSEGVPVGVSVCQEEAGTGAPCVIGVQAPVGSRWAQPS